MTATPRISVIVPHYNDLVRLDACLDALMRQDMAADAFEIVVADNNSPCGEDAVRTAIAGRARLAIAMTPGAGPARNAGVAAARGDIFAFTDSDCVPEPGWLSAGVAALSQADFVGGAMTVLVRDAARMSGAEAFESVFAFDNKDYVTAKHFTVTANLLCPRAVFEAVGPFHTEVSEDIEWCWRARDKGYRIGYAAKAVVGHPAREDWAQLKKKWGRMAAENHALMMARGGGMAKLRWLARTWMLPLSIPVHLLKLARTRTIRGVGNKLAGAGMLVRIRLWRFVEGHRLMLRSGH